MEGTFEPGDALDPFDNPIDAMHHTRGSIDPEFPNAMDGRSPFGNQQDNVVQTGRSEAQCPG